MIDYAPTPHQHATYLRLLHSPGYDRRPCKALPGLWDGPPDRDHPPTLRERRVDADAVREAISYCRQCPCLGECAAYADSGAPIAGVVAGRPPKPESRRWRAA